MQMNSNDIKWNKIQEIEKRLHEYYVYVVQQYLAHIVDDVDAAMKYASRDVWILANKLYDIATEGIEEETDYRSWITYPEHYTEVIERVIDLARYANLPHYSLEIRDSYWNQYDYANS